MSGPPPGDARFNPYAPPSANLHAAPAEPKAGELADRLARLGASILDTVLVWLALMPALLSTWRDFVQSFRSGAGLSQLWWVGAGAGQLVATMLTLALIALQSYLVATTGQSIGKRVARVRIVQMSDQPAGFVRGVLLRNWLFHGLAYVPVGGAILSLVDVLFIFRDDRRCLHDLVADTKVIPEIVAPTVPIATSHHGAFLLATKNEAFDALRLVQ